MAQAQSVALPKKWPIIVLPENRGSSTSTDSRLVNGYIEKEISGDYIVFKRPGAAAYSQPSGGAATGQGVYTWNGDVYAVAGGHLYKGTTSVGTVDTTGGVYRFSSCMGQVPKLQLGNGVYAYNYDAVNGLVQITRATITSSAGDLSPTIPQIKNIASTAGWAAGYSVSDLTNGTQIPLGAYIVSVDSGTQITINANALVTASAVAISVQSPGIPAAFVKGWSYLDGTTYLMDAKGVIWGDDLNDPTTWDPLNFLTVQIEPGPGVALAKQLVNVIALKDGETEVFYDAGNAAGSPLGRVVGAKVNWGCLSADSVRQVNGDLYWLATDRNGSVQVMQMRNLTASKISSPAVDRLLGEADFTTIYSLAVNYGGHRWYVLTLKGSNLTLAFDTTTELWDQWADGNGDYWPIVASSDTPVTAQTLLQHESDGHLYTLSSLNYSEFGAPILVDIYTMNYDGGTVRDKVLSELYFDADQVAGSVLQCRFSDDDYQTWSDYRKVDLGLKKPALPDNGSFKRRAYNFRHQSNTPFRIRAAYMQIDVGTM